MKPKSFTYPCDITLSIAHHDYGEYKLTVNYFDPNVFNDEVIQLSMLTTDIDLINRIKFNDIAVGDKLLMNEVAIIEATKEGIMKVLCENGKCCVSVNHTKTMYGVQYYFEQTIKSGMKDTIKRLFY